MVDAAVCWTFKGVTVVMEKLPLAVVAVKVSVWSTLGKATRVNPAKVMMPSTADDVVPASMEPPPLVTLATTVAEVEAAMFPSKSSMRSTGCTFITSPVRCATGSVTHSKLFAPAGETTTPLDSTSKPEAANFRT